MYSFIRSQVGNVQTAQDIVGRIFLKAYRHHSKAPAGPAATVWVFRIAHTVLIDHWRVEGRRESASVSIDDLAEFAGDGASPEAAYAGKERKVLLLSVMSELDKDDQHRPWLEVHGTADKPGDRRHPRPDRRRGQHAFIAGAAAAARTPGGEGYHVVSRRERERAQRISDYADGLVVHRREESVAAFKLEDREFQDLTGLARALSAIEFRADEDFRKDLCERLPTMIDTDVTPDRGWLAGARSVVRRAAAWVARPTDLFPPLRRGLRTAAAMAPIVALVGAFSLAGRRHANGIGR